jgi:hypothetical protein
MMDATQYKSYASDLLATTNTTIKDFSKLSRTLDNNKEELFGSARKLEGFIGTLATNDKTVRRFNDSLANALPGFKKVKSGWEYGGSIRYGVSPKASLDLEVNSMNPKSTTPNSSGDIHAKTPGIAIPLSLYYNLGNSGKSDFDFFFAEAHQVGSAGWTTLADAKGHTSTDPGSSCPFWLTLALESCICVPFLSRTIPQIRRTGARGKKPPKQEIPRIPIA